MRPQSEFSTFGTFGPPGASGADPSEEKFDEIREKGHNIAPSISSSMAINIAGYGTAAGPGPTAVPPSEAFAASNDGPTAVGGPQLHERPKYVFGQAPDDGHPGNNDDDATHGAYSSHPVQQTAYDQEAYAYAGGSGYQDAERAYQAAAGAAASAGYYDQNGYYYSNGGDPNAYAAGVGQYYDYSQHAQYQPQEHPQQNAYGGM
jgi:hypothetical protein